MSMSIKDDPQDKQSAKEYNTKAIITSAVVFLIVAPFFVANSAAGEIQELMITIGAFVTVLFIGHNFIQFGNGQHQNVIKGNILNMIH